MADPTEAPVPAIKPHTLERHGHVRVDNYYWLRERDHPEVREYLDAENRYLDANLEPLRELRGKLFEEFETRIKQTDSSVPYLRNGYFYYARMEAGKNYAIHCRKQGSLEAPEEILVDGNVDSVGHSYYSIGKVEVSPDNRLAAWSVDTVGRRFYTIRIRNTIDGSLLPDTIHNVTGSVEWSNDSSTLFYTRQDPETLRAYRVYRHLLGEDPAGDTLVFQEDDPTFHCEVGKTKSKQYLMIGSAQTLTTEWRFLDADQPDGEFQVLQPRIRGHEYQADHYAGHFYIRTNLDAKNFRLMRASVDNPAIDGWEEIIPHRSDTLIAGIEIFSDFLVIAERQNGLMQMRVRSWSGQDDHYLDFGEPAYSAGFGPNAEIGVDVVRYRYSSLTTPHSVFDYNMQTRSKTLLKQDEVLGGFNAQDYVTERLYAPSHDGAMVPVSIVYRKGVEPAGGRPLLQYGYGSYGASMDAAFHAFVISLLDRGFVYAIAHVRGGQEMGREWYEAGKLDRKKNTFQDFIAVTEYLVKQRLADPRRVYALGGSAGGLLIGAVINERPELYHGAIAVVPFVDVVTTMLDETIPLTTFEYDEWGNPNERSAYEYMLSYSPYDRVEAKPYPNLLVIAGLHDSQVQYWEPAKWVAKLRALKKGDSRLLLFTNMEAGHGGAAARYRKYEEVAMQYAFLLDLAGAVD